MAVEIYGSIISGQKFLSGQQGFMKIKFGGALINCLQYRGKKKDFSNLKLYNFIISSPKTDLSWASLAISILKFISVDVCKEETGSSFQNYTK